MTGIKDLPVELLGITFQYVAAPGFRVYEAEGVSDVELPAVPDRTLFPLNVAAVCTLWLRVLKMHPQHWQRVVIDVASDPAPFLDTLDLFTANSDMPLDLIVFSSQSTISKYVESSRVGIVFACLEPAMERYATITFRLVYQSSLPPAKAFLSRYLVSPLTELFLTCTMYDLSDDDVDDSDVPKTDDYQHFQRVAIHTDLRKLCLTGADVMDLCLSGALQTSQDIFEISINQIKFRQQFHDGTSSSQSFAVLTEFLHNIISSTHEASISLANISMEYRPSLKRKVKYPITVARMSFTNVSADFISTFFSTFTILAGHLKFVSFRNCVIPRVTEWYQHINFVGNGLKVVLELVDIPFRDNETARPSDQVLLLHNGESLYNTIEAFPADELRILRCDGVTDSLLQWLAGDSYAALEAPRMEVIKLHDCPNFTAHGMCALLVNRHRKIQRDRAHGTIRTLAEVEVFGRGPTIHHERDLEILQNQGSHQAVLHGARVSWNVEHMNSQEPGCGVTNLQPRELETSIWDRTSWGLLPVQL